MCLSAQFDVAVGAAISVVAIDAIRHHQTGRELPLALLPAVFAVHTFLSAVIWLGVEGTVSEQIAQFASVFYLFIAYALLPIFVPVAVLLIAPADWHRVAVLMMCAVGAIPAIGYSYALMQGWGTASPDSYYIAFGVEGTAGVLGVLYVVSTCGAMLLSGKAPIIAWGNASPSILVMRMRRSVAGIVRCATVMSRICRRRRACRRLWIKTSWDCAVILSTGIMSTPVTCLAPSA